jgi:hypothetical protein
VITRGLAAGVLFFALLDCAHPGEETMRVVYQPGARGAPTLVCFPQKDAVWVCGPYGKTVASTLARMDDDTLSAFFEAVMELRRAQREQSVEAPEP